jgi:hypothetical protein
MTIVKWLFGIALLIIFLGPMIFAPTKLSIDAVKARKELRLSMPRPPGRGTVVIISRGALVLLAAIGIAAFLVLLLGPVAQWATVGRSQLSGKDKADAVNATRQILLAAAAGATVLVGLGFTARTYYLSRRGQLTDRYTKAITQLASDKLTERLGGIYALEHLMRESPADHITIIDVLAAFIRENAPASPLSPAPDTAPPPQEANPKPCTDIQAALTVLARRPKRLEPTRYIDISRTNLRGADLRGAQLENCQLKQTWLQHANLSHARLQGACLRGAQLQHASLADARLEYADLRDAQAEQADLRGARLQHADLRRAQLRRADLPNADLSSARLAGACLEMHP